MASSLALKRLVSANLLPKSLSLVRPAATAPLASRLFNTDAVREYDSDGYDRELDSDPRSIRSLSRRRVEFFPDVFDPFSPPRSLSQVLTMMDPMLENPFFAATRGMGAGIRRGYDIKETEDAMKISIDLPALGKDDVKVTVEQNTLVIRGDGAKESKDEESGRKYSSRLDLPENVFKLEEIKAEMKNGVLKLVVPKIKEEERNDVFQVKVE